MPFYLLLFLIYGIKDFRKWCLITGIIALPLPISFTIGHVPHKGWADGITITLSDLSFLCGILYTMYSHRKRPIPSSILNATLAFLFACALSVINSDSVRLTSFQVIMLIKSFILYYVGSFWLLDTNEKRQTLVGAIIVSLVIQSTYAIAQHYFGFQTYILHSDGFRPPTLLAQSGAIRSSGTLGHPNQLAKYLLPLIFLPYVTASRHRTLRTSMFLATSLSILAFLFTYSRGAWIAFIPGAVALAVGLYRHHLIRVKTLYVFFLVGLLFLLLFRNDIRSRFERHDFGSANSRVHMMKLAAYMIADHPFVGIGGNTFQNRRRSYLTPELEEEFTTVVHNQYLLVTAECGLLGLLCYLWLLYAFAKEAKRCVTTSTDAFGNRLGLAVQAGILSLAISMCFDYYKSYIGLSNMYLLAAVCSASARIKLHNKVRRQRGPLAKRADPRTVLANGKELGIPHTS